MCSLSGAAEWSKIPIVFLAFYATYQGAMRSADDKRRTKDSAQTQIFAISASRLAASVPLGALTLALAE